MRCAIRDGLVLTMFLLSGSILAQPARLVTELQQAKPEDEGYSSRRLEALKGYLAANDTTGMIVLHRGKVILQYGDVTRPVMLTSVRKSILGLLYGNYVASGKIPLDATLQDLGIDDIGGLLPVEKTARVRHLLQARSGVFHKNTNPNGGDDLWAAPPRGTMPPGTYFLYNNWDFNVAGYIFEKQTGIDIFDALQKDLAEPLGMQDFDRGLQKKQEDDPTLSKYPAYRAWLSPRDMARIGQLMLQGGKWDGKQIVPADWIETITSLVTPVGELNPPQTRYYQQGVLWGYGYLWWVWEDHGREGSFQGAYTAMGNGGQFITVLPALDLVVAHTTLPAAPGQPARVVRNRDFHAALLQLISARCQGTCR